MRKPLVGVVALAVVVALGTMLRGEQKPAPSAQATETFRDADLAWAEVTAPANLSVIQRLRHDRLLYTMAQYELESRHLREAGRIFWETFPNDLRRYDWLLLTTILAPSYNSDVSDWRWNEDWLTFVPGNIDAAARSAWQADFEALKVAYMASEDIPQEDKRSLLFAEARNALNTRHEAYGDDPARDGRFVALMETIVERYPEPFHQDELGWMRFMQPFFAHISRSALLGDSRYGFTDSEAVRLATLGQGLFAEGHFLYDWLNVVADGGNVADTTEFEVPVFPNPAGQWRDLWNPIGMAWPAMSRERNDHPSQVARRVLRIKEATRGVEVGLRLWSESGPVTSEMISWYTIATTAYGQPRYWKSLLFGAGFGSGDRDFEFDRGLSAALDAIPARILASDDISVENVQQFEFGQARRLRQQAHRRFAETGDNSLGFAYLEEMYRLHEKYGRGTGDLATIGDIKRGSNLLSFYYEAGLDEVDVIMFLSRFAEDPDSELRTWSQSLSNLIRLRDEPFDFETVTFDGEPFDLEDLRGHVVFIDFWATSCGTCIEKMPQKHEIYLDYKDNGLAVLSVAADLFEKAPRIRRLVTQHDLSWLTLDGRAIWDRMVAEYSLMGVPQYMVLTREGTMAAGGSPTELHSLDDVRTVIEAELDRI